MLRRLPEAALKSYYTIPDRERKHRIAFPISKLWTELNVAVNHWSEWDEVLEGVFLSKIPSAVDCDRLIEFVNTTHANKPNPIARPLKLIVSTVDYFELGGSFPMRTIATPTHWQEKGVQQTMMPIQDFGATIPNDCIAKTIFEMRDCLSKGYSVLVHCKAGRGRSAMMCVIYAALFVEELKNLDPNEAFVKAFAMIQSKRQHIALDSIKSAKTIEAIIYIRETFLQPSLAVSSCYSEKTYASVLLRKLSGDKPQSLTDELSQYLRSDIAKLAITEMVSFKEIAIYAAHYAPSHAEEEVDGRCGFIRTLFDSILHAQDASWFLTLSASTSPARAWLMLPASAGIAAQLNLSLVGLGESAEQFDLRDAALRARIMSMFKDELVSHLVLKLGVVAEKIVEAITPVAERTTDSAFCSVPSL